MFAHSSSRLQLFLTHLLVILVPLGILVVFLSLYLPQRYTDEMARQLRYQLRLTRPLIEDEVRSGIPPARLEALVRRLTAGTPLRLTIIDRSGRVLAESERDPALLENHASRPEFRQALATGDGQAIRYSMTLGQEMLYVAVPLADGGMVLRLATPLRELQRVRTTIRGVVWGSVLIAAALALALAGTLGRRLNRPLERLQERVEQLAGGAPGALWTARVRPEGSAETRRLGAAFNAMAARLQDLVRREIEDRSRYETILRQMADGIVVTDPAGRVEMFNPAAGRLLGVAPAATIGRSLLEATFHSGLWELLERGLRERAGQSEEIRLLGGGRVLRVHVAPIMGAGERLAGGVLILQDLTDARRLEEMRRDFVANVSHELKSPVAAVRALAETLVLRGADRPELARDYAARINQEAERISDLLADLLDLSAVESGRREWRPEPVELAPLFARVAERFQPAAAEREVAFTWDAPDGLRAWADEAAIAQILGNLVENAIKYSPTGANVSLSARGGEGTEAPKSGRGEITISVADTGRGIPPEALPRIFERFYRVDSGRARSEGGTGLGLAIARHLVESQGGRIWAESNPGSGSCFAFTLPARG